MPPGLCPLFCTNICSTWDFCTHRHAMNFYEITLNGPISIQDILTWNITWNTVPFPSEEVEPLDYCSLFPSESVSNVMLISSQNYFLLIIQCLYFMISYHCSFSQLIPINTPILVAVITPLLLIFKFCLNRH